MTTKFAVLMVAAIVLSACGTTSDDGAGPTGPSKRLVVRGAVVPDGPEPAVKSKKARVKKASTVAVADASPAVPTERTVPMASPNTSGGGSDGGGTPVVSEPSTSAAPEVSPTAPSPSEVTTAPLAAIEPSTVTAEPVGDAPPAPTPSPLAIDFRDMLNTTIAGFPLWLMVVIGILLAAALVFGTGGGRRERAPERDYRDDREPDYDERRHGDAEPEPA